MIEPRQFNRRAMPHNLDRGLSNAGTQIWKQALDVLALLPQTQDTQAHLRLQALCDEGTSDEVGTGVREKVVQQLLAEEAMLDKEISAFDTALEACSVLLANPSSPMTSAGEISTPISDPPAHVPMRSVEDNDDDKRSFTLRPSVEPPATVHAPSPVAAAAAVADHNPVPTLDYPPIPTFHTQPLRKRHLKERKAELAGQLPLAPGRRVAFHVPPARQAHKSAGQNKIRDDVVEGEWILTIVRRNCGTDVNRYEVVDPEGEAGAEVVYKTSSLKNIIVLPTVGAPVDSPAHVSRFAPHSIESLVMAIYPGTSSFYRGKVVGRETERPVEMPAYGAAGDRGKKRASAQATAQAIPECEQRYLVAFDDDANRLQIVEMGDIAEWPGGQPSAA